ncbi:glycosyltransferase [Flavobacteriaceae bacterium]|nr:glycosyltransferase [Flavobacteriaceae bacterium]
MSPLVSIVIPTFNRSELLRETLDSVFNQTYHNWECIIVDDNSTDNTKQVISLFLEKDSRFQYYFGPDHKISGANACRNFAFRKSKGDFIQYLDDDDLLDSNKIEAQVKALFNKSSNTIATSKWDFFNEKPKDIKSQNLDVYRSFEVIEDFINSLSYSHGYFPPHAYLIPRSLILRAGEWNEYLKINQDGEFMCRIFTKAENVVFAGGAQVYYRQHNGSRTSALNSRKKIYQARKSWELIEATFQIRFGRRTRVVDISRKYLEQNISNRTLITRILDLFRKD